LLSAEPKPSVSRFVLDASTLVAILNSEEGGDEAVRVMEPGCYLSTVNLAESVGRLRDTGWSDDEIDEQLAVLGIEIRDFSRQQAFDTGFLDDITKAKRLALGDRACLALARELRLPALTGDRVWALVDVGVEVHLFR
jgi:PIN domain nuclease of toxin-antitoxin system